MIQLFGRRVGIIPIDRPNVSTGGIHIPQTHEERTRQGVVKYIGPDCKSAQLGSHVIYGAYNGELILIDDERIIVMDERYISATLDYNREEITIPGMYFKLKTGEYIPARYEETFELIKRAVQPMAQLLPKDWMDYKPKPEEYNMLEEDA